MRNNVRFIPTMVVSFSFAVTVAAVAALGAWSLDGGVRRLGTEEMQATFGLQTDYECFEDAGCCQGLACGTCPDCYECTNDGPPIGTCQWSSGMYCTELPTHDCGDLVQGACSECDEVTCFMDDPTVVGSCGTILQCQ